MQIKYIIQIIFTAGVLVMTACKKSEFLNAKPNLNLNVPSTLSDFQSLMDNYNLINQTPALGDMSSDNYFYNFTDWQAQGIIPQNCYTWAKDIFEGNGNISDWNLSYQQVLVANVVLEGLQKLNLADSDSLQYSNIKGSALFIRANAFYNLSQIFAPPYDSATAESDLGIPIRLSADVSITEQRSSIAVTYKQILDDLKNAAGLLQGVLPTTNINRPIKPAAYALLSKVYLSMRQYQQAGNYADSSLQLYNTLIDYNTINPISRVPFKRNNPEATYQAYQVTDYPIDGSEGVAQVDSLLYHSYAPNDLRKQIFFRVAANGKVLLKITYSGTYALFSGLAVNEMYLNRAESFARSGNFASACKDLNTLLVKRFITGTYIPFSAVSATEALDTILSERRKELPFSNVRWTDLRRLNKEGANIILTRTLNNQVYTLPPNSDLYTLPIPPDEAALSEIQQNIRN